MRKLPFITIILTTLLMISQVSIAEPLTIKADDDIDAVLAAQKGKRVTIMLSSGGELTGTVGEVNDDLVQLRELSGKEFFDAVINADKISAVVIRTKDQ